MSDTASTHFIIANHSHGEQGTFPSQLYKAERMKIEFEDCFILVLQSPRYCRCGLSSARDHNVLTFVKQIFMLDRKKLLETRHSHIIFHLHFIFIEILTLFVIP